MSDSGGEERETDAVRWSSLWCCVRPSVRAKYKWILRDSSGVLRRGRSMAVLGPSGSGKTTLLSLLSGQLATSSKVWSCGEVAAPIPTNIAYVAQDTPFFSGLTVRETLSFVARLERHPTLSVKDRVDLLLRKLALSSCADTRVGGNTGGLETRGISGGERRRLAIACELLRASQSNQDANGDWDSDELTFLIADEPTSGLDAFQADKVVDNLLEIAHEGAVVLFSIHQPRSAIFDKLDDVLLLAPWGHTCFAGPRSTALEHFARMGFEIPPNFNPAEYLIDLVSVDMSTPETERKSLKRIEMLQRAWQKQASSSSPSPSHSGTVEVAIPPAVPASPVQVTQVASFRSKSSASRQRRRPNVVVQFFNLLGRALKQTRREVQVHATRAVGTVILALAFGATYRVGNGQKSIKRRAAVMFQVCINSAMMSTIKTLNSFPRERAVVRKEIGSTSKLYGVGPYFLAKMLVEGPVDACFPVLFGSIVGRLSGLNTKTRGQFLGTLALQGISASALGMSVGALAPTTESALAIGPVVMVLSIMLGDSGGMFAEIPAFLKPVAKFSMIKWGFDGCVGAEFKGLAFTCDDLEDMVGAPMAKKMSQRERDKLKEQVCLRRGRQVLEGMGLREDEVVGEAARQQTRLILLNLFATYVLLNLKDRSEGHEFAGSSDKPPISFPDTKGRKIWEL